MRLPLWLVGAATLACASCATFPSDDPAAVQAKFVKVFNNAQVEKVEKAEIPGLWAVYAGGRIFYYAPDSDVVVFGELYSMDGRSLTQARIDGLMQAKADGLDRAKAIVVGEGKTEVVAFVDPDCGYCAASARWFEQRNFENTRLLVFFQPMETGSAAYQRALELACAPVELRREAMRHLFERGATPAQPALACQEGRALLAEHATIAKNFGVVATPVFVVGGQTVMGFQPDRLVSLIDGPVATATQTQGVFP